LEPLANSIVDSSEITTLYKKPLGPPWPPGLWLGEILRGGFASNESAFDAVFVSKGIDDVVAMPNAARED
jgi:hypothetical protein